MFNKIKIFCFAACLALGVGLAAATPAAAAGFNITDVVRASPADLSAALADATGNGDVFASQCYAGVIAYNDANPKAVVGFTKPVGPVAGFQTARDVVKGLQNPADFIPKELVLACGPLALDIQGDVLKAARTVGPTLFGLKL